MPKNIQSAGPSARFAGGEMKLFCTGGRVAALQQHLNTIARFYPIIPKLLVDGKFGPKTQNGVILFQYLFDLKVDGIVGEKTWNRLVGMGKFLRTKK